MQSKDNLASRPFQGSQSRACCIYLPAQVGLFHDKSIGRNSSGLCAVGNTVSGSWQPWPSPSADCLGHLEGSADTMDLAGRQHIRRRDLVGQVTGSRPVWWSGFSCSDIWALSWLPSAAPWDMVTPHKEPHTLWCPWYLQTCLWPLSHTVLSHSSTGDGVIILWV